MVPVVTDSIVVAVVVGGSNSLQLFRQQVSMKPGCDGQHPASVTPHIDVHLWHLGEIQLYRRYGFISSASQQMRQGEGQSYSAELAPKLTALNTVPAVMALIDLGGNL